MSIDGFRLQDSQPFVGFDPAVADRVFGGLEWISKRLDVQVAGAERIPPGRALLVANHAFGWDVVFPMAAVWRQSHRRVWALGEHLWWKFPFLRRLAVALGTVDGTRENADRLLSEDELVLVLPGGLREAVKPKELRYRLLWGRRFGFVQTVIRNGAPIVPLASIGADDLFDFVGNAYRRGERLLRRTGVPVPLPSRILPIPYRVQLRFVFGDSIPPPPPAYAEDPIAVARFRHEVAGALHELIETELAHRIGVDV